MGNSGKGHMILASGEKKNCMPLVYFMTLLVCTELVLFIGFSILYFQSNFSCIYPTCLLFCYIMLCYIEITNEK